MLRHFRPLIVCALASCIVLVLPACKESTYSIELRPAADGLSRTLSWAPESHIRRPGEVAHLSAAYGLPEPGPEKASFAGAGVFTHRMPDDFGGVGMYSRCQTPLGTLHGYIERFRGEADPLLEWERQQEAIDLLVDVFIAWTEKEFAGRADFAALAGFADRQLRRDLRSLAIICRDHMPAIVDQDSPPAQDDQEATENRDRRTRAEIQTLSARAYLFLVERGYFELDELPMLSRVGIESEDVDWLSLTILQRAARRAAGEPDAQLVVLQDQSDWTDRLTAFAESDAATASKLQAWRKRFPVAGPQGETAEQTLASACVIAVGFRALAGYDELNLTLQIDGPPLATNGTWLEQSHSLAWRSNVPVREALPARAPVAFAVWAQPAPEEQTRLFGRVALKGESLTQYCIWHAGLTPEQRVSWDEFYKSLQPGPGLAERLYAFQFSGPVLSDDPPLGAMIVAEAAEGSGDEDEEP